MVKAIPVTLGGFCDKCVSSLKKKSHESYKVLCMWYNSWTLHDQVWLTELRAILVKLRGLGDKCVSPLKKNIKSFVCDTTVELYMINFVIDLQNVDSGLFAGVLVFTTNKTLPQNNWNTVQINVKMPTDNPCRFIKEREISVFSDIGLVNKYLKEMCENVNLYVCLFF